MDIEAARRLFNEALHDQAQDVREASEIDRRIKARHKFLESLGEMFPTLKFGPESLDIAKTRDRLSELVSEWGAVREANREPRGKAAAKAVLLEHPGTFMSVRAVATDLIRRGWISPDSTDPEAAARQSLYRLADTDETIERSTAAGLLAFRYREPSPGNAARALRELVGDA